jgi:hypothetical protein
MIQANRCCMMINRSKCQFALKAFNRLKGRFLHYNKQWQPLLNRLEKSLLFRIQEAYHNIRPEAERGKALCSIGAVKIDSFSE